MPVISSKGQVYFPDLAAFMSGWFHQDFDLNGNSLEDVVAAFRADSDPDFVDSVVHDINAFLATGEVGIENRFQEFFRPDVIPTAFRPTTQDFLMAVRTELVAGKTRP